jgi:predicted HTH transcriptional regulator
VSLKRQRSVPSGRSERIQAGIFASVSVASHAVVSVTEAGKKREIYEGNLISQYRKLLAKLEAAEVNPLLKAKKRRTHDERTAYPPRVPVELLVNMLVHRDYELAEPASAGDGPHTRPTATT